MANSVDPDDQMLLRHLIWVTTVCSGLSVPILGLLQFSGLCENYLYGKCPKIFKALFLIFFGLKFAFYAMQLFLKLVEWQTV